MQRTAGREATVAADQGVREHIAWLLWCIGEGYVNASDREGMTNWLLDDPATLHADDAALRPHLLAMADEVLAAINPAEFTLTRWLLERNDDGDSGRDGAPS
jgi:hypothetical protein